MPKEAKSEVNAVPNSAPQPAKDSATPERISLLERIGWGVAAKPKREESLGDVPSQPNKETNGDSGKESVALPTETIAALLAAADKLREAAEKGKQK
jgi:hypothetical protein